MSKSSHYGYEYYNGLIILFIVVVTGIAAALVDFILSARVYLLGPGTFHHSRSYHDRRSSQARQRLEQDGYEQNMNITILEQK